MSDRADIQPKSSISKKKANDCVKEVDIPLFLFDEMEMFAIVMEAVQGGELFYKVVKVYQKETFMVEEIIECKFICENW